MRRTSHKTISVIIPAYRAERTIGRAIESICAQTTAPDEIIVVDDGSPDDISKQVALFGDRVRLVRKANGGVASARNLGMEESAGDLIAFLDADDYWEPDKLERQIAVFERHPEVGLVASRYFEEAPKSTRELRQMPGLRVDQPIVASGSNAFELATRIWTSTVIVRRSVLKANRFEKRFEPAEDRELWFRIVLATAVFVVSRPLATAVLEPGSLSRRDVDYGYRPMVEVARTHSVALGGELRTFEARIYRAWAAAHLSGGQPRLALRPAWDRLVRQPLSPEGWWVLFKSMLQYGQGTSGNCASGT